MSRFQSYSSTHAATLATLGLPIKLHLEQEQTALIRFVSNTWPLQLKKFHHVHFHLPLLALIAFSKERRVMGDSPR